MRAPPLAVLETPGSPALEQDPRRERVRQYLEVRATEGGTQVGIGGTRAPAALHRHVQTAETLLLKTVDVRRLRIARLGGGGEPGGMQGIAEAAVASAELARAAAVLVAPLRALLGALEIRQHIPIRPPRRAFPRPALEVLGIAADVDQAVDRGGASEHLAARRMHAPAVQVRLGFGVVEPIVFRHVHRDRQRRGHLNEYRTVGSTEFDHEDAARAIGAQAVGEHAARASRAHDDVVETCFGHPRAPGAGWGLAPQYGASTSPIAT